MMLLRGFIQAQVVYFFQVITLEGWVDIMYFVMDAHSFYNFIYFILLIIVSSSTRSGGRFSFGAQEDVPRFQQQNFLSARTCYINKDVMDRVPARW